MSRTYQPPPRTRNVTIRISAAEHAAWTAAAAAQDRKLSSWLRWVADQEAGRRPARAGRR